MKLEGLFSRFGLDLSNLPFFTLLPIHSATLCLLFYTNSLILLQGGVGKTSVRRCYMGDEFRAESLLSTVGVDWDTKVIVVDGVNVTMKIWVCRFIGG